MTSRRFMFSCLAIYELVPFQAGHVRRTTKTKIVAVTAAEVFLLNTAKSTALICIHNFWEFGKTYTNIYFKLSPLENFDLAHL